jgi:hypothetical protein
MICKKEKNYLCIRKALRAFAIMFAVAASLVRSDGKANDEEHM